MNVVNIKGAKEAPKAVRSSMETLLVTQEVLAGWKLPSFQRELRESEKVKLLAEYIKQNGGIIPGVVTLGRIGVDKTLWLVDGQHRRHSAMLSELQEFIVDVRICSFDSKGEMAREFVNLQTALVKMRPDDILRGLEDDEKSLRTIRRECPFVAYTQVKRGHGTAVLGMSTALRSWVASQRDTPTCSESTVDLVGLIDGEQLEHMVRFLTIARQAWGDGPESYRLWSTLNLTIAAWLYQQLVIDRQRGIRRYVVLSVEQFKKCLMSVGAASDYSDWLVGRTLCERDRSPCFVRLKSIFAARLRTDTGVAKPLLPQPPWAAKTTR